MYVDVALEVGTFIYRVSPNLHKKVKVGSLVNVPLRNREADGWIIKIKNQSALGGSNIKNIKEVIELSYPDPLISHELIELGKWMASYYQSSLGSALNLMVPEIGKEGAPKQSSGPVSRVRVKSVVPSVISDAFRKNEFKSILLYGGSRERIYLGAIEEALSYGRGAILLVPEIELTPQFLSLLQNRFGSLSAGSCGVALLHSGLKKEARWCEWLRIKSGVCPIVVGTMSAVFAPVHNLGVMIIDEEQDTSYKSEKYPRYSTTVVGAMRAKLVSCVYIGGSATPSIEAFYNTENEKSTLIKLTHPQKPGRVFVVDMRKEIDPIFSELLLSKLKAYIKSGEKVILFLNRRGFSSFILCEDCGYVPRCPNCDIPLTYHIGNSASGADHPTLNCHYCSYSEGAPGYCPECKGINLSRKGVGTAHVERVFTKLFPGIKIFRLDLDTVSRTRQRRVVGIFKSFERGEIQVLLGTQLVAPPITGFPVMPKADSQWRKVGLVGVISTDIGLNLPDFRGPERSFSLLMRLIEQGREIVLQTYNPGHPVLKYLRTHDYLGFYRSEKLARKEHGYPPYSHLVRIVVEAKKEDKVQKMAQKVKAELERQELEFLGPSPCPLQRKKGKIRLHFLLKVTPDFAGAFPSILPKDSIIDVDPVEFD